MKMRNWVETMQISYDEYVNSKGKKFIGHVSSERQGIFHVYQ